MRFPGIRLIEPTEQKLRRFESVLKEKKEKKRATENGFVNAKLLETKTSRGYREPANVSQCSSKTKEINSATEEHQASHFLKASHSLAQNSETFLISFLVAVFLNEQIKVLTVFEDQSERFKHKFTELGQ